MQRRPEPAAAEQESQSSEIQRRTKPADEVMDLEPMRDDREGEFYREIGPEDSTAAAPEGEAVPADDPEVEAETPAPEEPEQQRK